MSFQEASPKGIRLLKFPENVKNAIRQIIASSGHTSVQDERASYHGSYEFKMNGNPWRASGNDAVHSRRLMNRIVGDLFNMGWLLSLSTDISKNAEDLDTLIFRYHLPPPPPCEWLAVAFSSGDKLRLIGAPADLRDAVVAAMQRAKKLQAHRPHAYVGDCYELKMWGYPFRSSGSDSMGARALVLDFLSVLEGQGWSVYASIGQKKHNEDNNNNNDTWHCCRRLDWSPGLPVYHH
ncbi:hypothetical protein PG991_003858 [Apiospora marii]|uniref:Uncharacterized protein n=1 Tax=Apiospora marii TaxID=335849 RepID=A0ABR1S6X3_9PEZI